MHAKARRRQSLARNLLPTIAKPKRQEAMVLSQSLSRTMRWPLCWPRLDAAVPYLLLLFSGLMIAGAVWEQQRSADQNSDVIVSRLAASAAQDVAASMEQFDRTLQAVLARHQSPELQNQDPLARNAALFERIQREPYFAFINVLDEKGKPLASLPQNDNNWADRDYFKVLQNRHIDSLFIGGRFSPASERSVGFTISRRMMDSGGNFVGLVVMACVWRIFATCSGISSSGRANR